MRSASIGYRQEKFGPFCLQVTWWKDKKLVAFLTINGKRKQKVGLTTKWHEKGKVVARYIMTTGAIVEQKVLQWSGLPRLRYG